MSEIVKQHSTAQATKISVPDSTGTKKNSGSYIKVMLKIANSHCSGGVSSRIGCGNAGMNLGAFVIVPMLLSSNVLICLRNAISLFCHSGSGKISAKSANAHPT